jgi:hypothetical protein
MSKIGRSLTLHCECSAWTGSRVGLKASRDAGTIWVSRSQRNATQRRGGMGARGTRGSTPSSVSTAAAAPAHYQCDFLCQCPRAQNVRSDKVRPGDGKRTPQRRPALSSAAVGSGRGAGSQKQRRTQQCGRRASLDACRQAAPLACGHPVIRRREWLSGTLEPAPELAVRDRAARPTAVVGQRRLFRSIAIGARRTATRLRRCRARMRRTNRQRRPAANASIHRRASAPRCVSRAGIRSAPARARGAG